MRQDVIDNCKHGNNSASTLMWNTEYVGMKIMKSDFVVKFYSLFLRKKKKKKKKIPVYTIR